MPVRVFLRGKTWFAEGYDAQGRRWKKSTRQRDKRAAERVAVDYERRMAAAPDQAAPALPLRVAYQRLIQVNEQKSRSPATRKYHQEKVSHLVRLLGEDFDIRATTKEDVDEYINRRLPEGASLHTATKELGVLRQLCILHSIPWPRKWLPSMGEVYTPREVWLTPEQYLELLKHLGPDRRDYVVVWAWTGIDRGPFYRLTAQHVDVKRKQLWIPDRKNAHRPRWVSLAEAPLAVLEARAERNQAGPLFEPWDNVYRGLRRACKRAGVPTVTIKDLRRTFASWMANAGVPMKTCATLLGHGSTQMVEKVYARIGVDSQKEAIEAMNQWVGGAK
jgi:integrase